MKKGRSKAKYHCFDKKILWFYAWKQVGSMDAMGAYMESYCPVLIIWLRCIGLRAMIDHVLYLDMLRLSQELKLYFGFYGWATIRPKRQFVPSDNSSQIPKSDNSSQASVNSSHFEKATIRPICKKRQFIPNCLIDQQITNLLKAF